MKLSIEVDNETLSRLINDELDRFDVKDVHDLAMTALKAYFSDPKNAEALVFKEGYGGRYSELRGSFERLLMNNVRQEDIQEFTNAIMAAAREHGKEIIMSTLANFLSSQFFSWQNQSTFVDNLMKKMGEQ